MKKFRIITSIILAVLAVALIACCAVCGINIHQCQVLEMQEQIAQLGYYKSDVTLLIGNSYKIMAFTLGGVFSGLIGVSCGIVSPLIFTGIL